MSVASEQLTQHVINGIQERKGLEITKLDMRSLGNSICDFFVICHGTSNRQVEAIAEAVEEEVRKQTGEKPVHREGYANAEWILLDFVDVIVHVFQKQAREHYALEDLWADALTEEIVEPTLLRGERK